MTLARWTPQEQQTACALWLSGMSDADIAERLEGRSKMAVRKFIKRQGLKRSREQINDAERVRQRVAYALKHPDGFNFRVNIERLPPRVQVSGEAWRRLEFHPSKTLMQLGPNDCRWPVGDDDIQEFCAAPREFLSPYCACHTKMGVPK